jgi:DNA invertase Pin-like site-specific DNA recombinase
MPPSRRSLGVKAQLDREIRELDRERDRLLAARAALEGKAVIPQARAPQITQDQVAEYLEEHPNSSYTEIATALEARPTVIAAHLNRGKKSGRFSNTDDGWTVKG